jgi:predicted RNA-binding protein with PIN domain
LSTPLVIVDGENVRRSTWPNIGRQELVERCAAWARREHVRALVVFDGDAPTARVDGPVEVAGSGGETADAWIARRAAELRAGETAFWLVTSDRALRDEASPGAQQVIGGGAFASMVTAEGS